MNVEEEIEKQEDFSYLPVFAIQDKSWRLKGLQYKGVLSVAQATMKA